MTVSCTSKNLQWSISGSVCPVLADWSCKGCGDAGRMFYCKKKRNKDSCCYLFLAIIPFFKGLVACCHSFYYFTLIKHTYIILLILFVEYHSWSPHCFRSVEGLLWGAEQGFELGPAIQQADALLSEPRRTLIIILYDKYCKEQAKIANHLCVY